MSDQVQENAVEEEVLEDVVDSADQEVEAVESDDNLEEAKKASMGDPSEIPDPEPKKAPEPKAKMPSTKVGMIQAMVDYAKKQKKDDVKQMVKSMYNMNSKYHPEEVEATGPTLKEMIKVSKDDINITDDVKALFGNEDLSEDFKSKAETIFEAAVLSKVNEVLETATLDMNAEIEAEKEIVKEDLVKKLDDYLEYVAEEWVKENELAIEKGIRSEIVENFMVGLKNLFTENYIDIPEEKVDIVDEMAAKVEELENSVNEEIEKNIEVKKELAEIKKSQALADISEDLTETQKEKLKSLAEGVSYEEEDFADKLKTLKENYFPVSEEVVENDVSEEEPLENLEEDSNQVNGSMAMYTQAISRSIKK
tara:strand:+ start:2345 stop:3442 length:1098 start_codon:yes stop_codon:yes gene_type:complete